MLVVGGGGGGDLNPRPPDFQHSALYHLATPPPLCHPCAFFLLVLQDKAPDVKPMPEEDISQEDWLSIKASLAQANEREELEKIKEDRVEYQEVQYTTLTTLCHYLYTLSI